MRFSARSLFSIFCISLIFYSAIPVTPQVVAHDYIIPKVSFTIGSDGFDFLTALNVDSNNNSLLTGYFSYPIYNIRGSGPRSFYPGPYYDINPDVFTEYAIVGSNASYHYSGKREIPLTKVNSSGLVTFSNYFGGNGSDTANDILSLENGNIIIVGETDSTSFYDYGRIPNRGQTDGLIIQLSKNGTMENVTTIGGSGFDDIDKIMTLNDGSLILAGTTTSHNFPTLHSYQNFTMSNTTQSDIFVQKYSRNMTLEFSTIFGGTSSDRTTAMIVDGNNNIFIGGISLGDDFPIVNSGFDQNNGGTDIVLLKLNQNGTLLKSTYFGGKTIDVVNDMKMLSSHQIVMVGITYSNDFPVDQSRPGIDRVFNTENAEIVPDGFFSIFDTNLNQQTTGYVGGSQADSLEKVAVDNQGYFYVTGWTRSSDYPVRGPFQRPPAFNDQVLDVAEDGSNQLDVVLSKFNSSGYMAYSIFYGGVNNDAGTGVNVRNVGDDTIVTIAGYTGSSYFPTYNKSVGGVLLDNSFFLNLDVPNGYFPLVAYPGRDHTVRNIIIAVAAGISYLIIYTVIYRYRKLKKKREMDNDQYREKHDLIKEVMKQ